MDASTIQLIMMSYLERDSDRAKDHLKALEKELHAGDGLFYRYRHADDFGEPETTFLICAFWYVEALASVGRVDEAIKYFEKARELSNGEEYGESQLDLLESLAKSYFHAGNKEKSAQYYSEYFALKDSIQEQGTLLAEDELILYEYYRDSIESEQLILQRELTQTSNERDEIQVEANQNVITMWSVF